MTRARDVANIDGILTTTGDTFYASSGGTPARLGIGSTDQVLKVSGGVPAWATPTPSAMTHIATTTLTSAASFVEFASISSSYQNLMAIWQVRGDQGAANVVTIQVRLNGDTASNYRSSGIGRYATANASNPAYVWNDSGTSAGLQYATQGAVPTDQYTSVGQIIIPNYKNTTLKKVFYFTVAGEADAPFYYSGAGTWNNTAAISTVRITCNGGNFITGSSISLYGLGA